MPVARVSALRFLLFVVLSTLFLTLIQPPAARSAVGSATMGGAKPCRQLLIYLTDYYGPVAAGAAKPVRRQPQTHVLVQEARRHSAPASSPTKMAASKKSA